MRLALLGDLHGHWSAEDARAIDAAGYDLVLFVGDLADPWHRHTLDVARRVALLETPAILIPGNHDGTTPWGVLAEALGRGVRRPGAGRRGEQRISLLRQALGSVTLAGYSVHPLPDHGMSVIAARPHAMDGARASFAPMLEARFGVGSLEASYVRLRSLVDAAEGDLLFLAHNGPFGLGTDPDAPFAALGRDLGDPDLAEAVRYARARGRRVLAVLAGHVHHRGTRRWQVDVEGTVFVNAARVPRVYAHEGRSVRQHLEVTVAGGRANVRPVLS